MLYNMIIYIYTHNNVSFMFNPTVINSFSACEAVGKPTQAYYNTCIMGQNTNFISTAGGKSVSMIL